SYSDQRGLTQSARCGAANVDCFLCRTGGHSLSTGPSRIHKPIAGKPLMTFRAIWKSCAIILVVSLADRGKADDAGAVPAVLWRSRTASASIDLSEPIVVGDSVIVGTGNGLLQARSCSDG